MSGIKDRPSRIFQDPKSKQFYVYHKGQRKLVKIPKGYNLKQAQIYISDQLYGRVAKSKKPINDKYYSVEKPKPVRPIYSDYKRDRIDAERNQDRGDKRRLEYYQDKIKNGIALTTAEQQDYELVKKKLQNEQEKIEKIKRNKISIEAKLKSEEEDELKKLISLENESKLEEKKKIEKPSVIKRIKKAIVGPKSAPAPPSSPREEKMDEPELEESEIKEPVSFHAEDYIPVIMGYEITRGAPPAAFGRIDEKLPNEIKYRRLKQLRDDRTYDFFKLVKDNFDLNRTDVPQFFAWNGVLNSNKIIVNILYKVIEWLEEQDEDSLLETFNGIYNIDNTMSKDEIIKQVLRYLDPIQYITLVSAKKIPNFGRFGNPDQLGRGNKEMKENTSTKLPALYDDEIMDFFKDEPNFGGVISSDEIHKLPKHIPMGFIMNLDPRKKDGSHWVACYMSGDSIEYFDPFGEDPSEDFMDRMHKFINNMELPTLQKFKINKIKQQHGNSFRCGYHCIRFLDDRFNGIPWVLSTRFQKGDEILDNSKHGEKKIKEEFKYI